MLSFGPLGAVIMVAIIAACACWAATLARYATERGASFFVGAVLLVTTIISMSESIFMERHSVHTIIFMVAFGVARVLSQRLWSPAPLEATPLQPAYAGAR